MLPVLTKVHFRRESYFLVDLLGNQWRSHFSLNGFLWTAFEWILLDCFCQSRCHMINYKSLHTALVSILASTVQYPHYSHSSWPFICLKLLRGSPILLIMNSNFLTCPFSFNFLSCCNPVSLFDSCLAISRFLLLSGLYRIPTSYEVLKPGVPFTLIVDWFF